MFLPKQPKLVRKLALLGDLAVHLRLAFGSPGRALPVAKDTDFTRAGGESSISTSPARERFVLSMGCLNERGDRFGTW